MGRRVIALIAAALVALFGVIAIVVYAQGADRRALADAEPQTVYITQQVVPAGTTRADALARKLIVDTKVPAKARPVGALSEISDTLKTKVAVSDIGIGEYVLANRFGDMPGSQSALPVPSGMVAISVQLSAPAGVNHFPTPGSHLVLYSIHDVVTVTVGPSAVATPVGERQKETTVLLPDVQVIGVNTVSIAPVAGPTATPAAGGGGGGDSITYTVAVSPQDAARLVHAISASGLYAGLLGQDAKVDTQYSVTMQNIFEKR